MKVKHILRKFSTSKKFADFDISQTKLFDEQLILVDRSDNLIGKTTKLNGHLKENNNKYPHRAFSVFLFNHENKMLIQKRSTKKVTFPNLWSNTCCSHPIYNEEELVKENNKGIKTAASRRMEYELKMGYIKDYFLFEKVLYRADSDTVFEEYELDYILLGKHKFEISDIRYNTDEVSDVMLVCQEELLEMVNINSLQITPWFKLVIQNRVNDIWNSIDNLSHFNESDNIICYL